MQKYQIEHVAVKLGIPLEAIAIKMSPFQAIKPMPIKVMKGVDKAIDLLRMRVEDAPKGSNILVIGVGNTCGIPNTNKNLNTIKEAIKKEARRKRKEELSKKKKGFFKRKPRKTDYDEDEDDDGGSTMIPLGGGLSSIGMFISFIQSIYKK